MPRSVVDRARAPRHVGLPQVVRGIVARRRSRRTARAASRSSAGSRSSGTPMQLRDRVAGDVVLGRAEPAGHEHDVGRDGGQPSASHDAVEVVADDLMVAARRRRSRRAARPIHWAFVFAICPSSSSVPTPTTSTRTDRLTTSAVDAASTDDRRVEAYVSLHGWPRHPGRAEVVAGHRRPAPRRRRPPRARARSSARERARLALLHREGLGCPVDRDRHLDRALRDEHGVDRRSVDVGVDGRGRRERCRRQGPPRRARQSPNSTEQRERRSPPRAAGSAGCRGCAWPRSPARCARARRRRRWRRGSSACRA